VRIVIGVKQLSLFEIWEKKLFEFRLFVIFFVFVLPLPFFGSFSERNKKFYIFTNVPVDWEGQAAVAATATAAAIPFVAGLRTVFLQEFRQDNFVLIQEAKLRKPFQGENEDAASYYYDVLHMCHVINPEFLELVKIHTETSILLDRRSYDEQDASTPAVASISMSEPSGRWLIRRGDLSRTDGASFLMTIDCVFFCL
jgi:hypothetical protein